jgi:NTP pyrophosphatase (non-canonical NTP hydrolase)
MDDELASIARQCMSDSEKWFPNTAHDLVYNALALAGEAGEFGNVVKKVIRGDNTVPEVLSDLREELADVFIYLMNLVELLNMDLTREYIMKRETNLARFGGRDATGPG